MPERDDLDRLIDSELARYAEPRPGLEQRILTSVSDKVNRSRLRWLLIAIPAPIGALVLLFAIAVFNAPRPQPTYHSNTPTIKPLPEISAPLARTAPKPLSGTHARSRNQTTDPVRRSVNARPKLDLFPTLQPLSKEEQAITRFGSEAREADRRALVEDRQHIDEPVTITAINVSPLPSLNSDQN